MLLAPGHPCATPAQMPTQQVSKSLVAGPILGPWEEERVRSGRFLCLPSRVGVRVRAVRGSGSCLGLCLQQKC